MHDFLTVAIPFREEYADVVESELDKMGNPAEGFVRDALRDSGVHFMSISILRGGVEHETFLIIEGSSDRELDTILSNRLEEPLRNLLTAAHISHQGSTKLRMLFRKYAVPTGAGLFSTPGLNFTGTPKMSVERILGEYRLSRRVRDFIETKQPSGTALQVLQLTRKSISEDDELSPLLIPEPTPILDPPPTGGTPIVSLVFKGLLAFGWPFFTLSIVISMVLGFWAGQVVGTFTGVVTGFCALLLGMGAFAGLLGGFYRRLRKLEQTDIPDNSVLVLESLTEITQRENKTLQNHLGGYTPMKPGIVRNLAIRLVFWIIGNTIPFRSRPGFLGELGTIHFARWVLIPRTNKLLFLSNYGGSWESYLEDFITKAHGGLTGVWSNTIGFPRTKNLFIDGATDGDRFKRWARRYQTPTRFWYSAYPHLTTDRIRRNAAIRQGLASASTIDEATAWISCLGSRPRGNSMIETPDVQSILFGGMASLRNACCLLVQLPEQNEDSKTWLNQIAKEISFGDRRPADQALMVAFTPSGLAKLGCSPEVMQEFPIAFQEGMSKDHRSQVLGDTGDDRPESWAWGHADKTVDAALLLYCETKDELQRLTKRHTDSIITRGGNLVHRIDMDLLKPNKAPREAFGFVDGISQPIIRGMRNWNSKSDPIHVVEPGEILLGYRDNRGQLPNPLRVSASSDPHNVLPVAKPDSPDTDFPEFSMSGANAPRDLGRNGTFLVIRQLRQDTEKFNGYLSNTAKELLGHPAVPRRMDAEQLAEWVAAKMVGRWRDGTSLVRFPDRPGSGWNGEEPMKPDNGFLLGADDALGFRCPFGAHIRRSNPRESFTPGSDEQLSISNRHRILRMGRSYSTTGDASEKGLLFMCVNADIERQFEFIQQTWLMSTHFHGLDGEVDSILGRGQKSGRLTIPTANGPILLSGIQDFVTVRGGSYFFMPGRQAIRFLADDHQTDESCWSMSKIE